MPAAVAGTDRVLVHPLPPTAVSAALALSTAIVALAAFAPLVVWAPGSTPGDAVHGDSYSGSLAFQTVCHDVDPEFSRRTGDDGCRFTDMVPWAFNAAFRIHTLGFSCAVVLTFVLAALHIADDTSNADSHAIANGVVVRPLACCVAACMLAAQVSSLYLLLFRRLLTAPSNAFQRATMAPA